VPAVKISLHTNGTLILQQLELFNQYDRATISIPSLEPNTCLKMTGSSSVLDLERIVASARIPIKISTLLTSHNVQEIPQLVERLRKLGIRRQVLRKLYGGLSPEVSTDAWRLRGEFAGNPIYDAKGLEITVWDFDRTQLDCLNLFPDGRIVDSYLLKPISQALEPDAAWKGPSLDDWGETLRLPASGQSRPSYELHP